MGTITYFDKAVQDAARERSPVEIDLGTTGYAGNGPQLFLRFEGSSVIFSHEDAKEFCAAASRIADYLGYESE